MKSSALPFRLMNGAEALIDIWLTGAGILTNFCCAVAVARAPKAKAAQIPNRLFSGMIKVIQFSE
jgi:hypothetical protein